MSLFAGRVSAETTRASQLRVYFAAMAYVLTHGLLFAQVYHNLRQTVPLRA